MKLKVPRRRVPILFLLTAFAQLLRGQSSHRTHATQPAEYTFKIVQAFPHDTTAFTQGLAFRDGFLYEGTGLSGRSSLRKVRLETGEVVQRVDLAPEFFGEGITLLKNEVVQLTWLSHTGFVYDVSDFRLLRRFSYSGEGWGLTTNSREVFMSDGTPRIRVLDPNTLEEKRLLTVHDGGTLIDRLNELEFVDGEIFANVWQTDRIARISPQSGKIVGWIDLKGLLSPIYHLDSGAVLNGIAYDSNRKRLFVTGKLWPRIFEILLVAKHPPVESRTSCQCQDLCPSAWSEETSSTPWALGANGLDDCLVVEIQHLTPPRSPLRGSCAGTTLIDGVVLTDGTPRRFLVRNQ